MHGITISTMVGVFRKKLPTTPRLNKLLGLYCELAPVDPDTMRRNARVFRLFVRQTGNVRAVVVTKLMATRFQASLMAAGKAKATIKSYCASVSSVFGWAVENIEGVSNPFKGLRKPKLDKTDPVFFTRDEMDRLYQAIENLEWRDPVQRLQWRALLMVADTCGFRIGEILNLRWLDIDLDDRIITVRYRPQKPGVCWEWGTKGHRDRFMPISDALLVLLYRMRETCPWLYPFLPRQRCEYCQQHSSHLSDGVRKRPYNLYGVWKRIRRQAQIEGDGAFHQVRRTAATEFGEHLTASQLRSAFGWQEIATAQHYIGTRNSTQRKAVVAAQAARTAGDGS